MGGNKNAQGTSSDFESKVKFSIESVRDFLDSLSVQKDRFDFWSCVARETSEYFNFSKMVFFSSDVSGKWRIEAVQASKNSVDRYNQAVVDIYFNKNYFDGSNFEVFCNDPGEMSLVLDQASSANLAFKEESFKTWLQDGGSNETAHFLPLVSGGQTLGLVLMIDSGFAEESSVSPEVQEAFELYSRVLALSLKTLSSTVGERIASSIPEQNPSPIIRCDIEGRILYRNRAAKEILPSTIKGANLGGAEAEGLGYLPGDIFRLSEFSGDESQVRSVINFKGRRYQVDVVYSEEDDYFNVYLVDITELAESQAYNQNIVDSMGEMLFVLNLKGEITFLNKTSSRVLGFEQNQLLGQKLAKLTVDQNLFTGAQLFESFSNGRISDYQTELIAKNRELVPVILSGQFMDGLGEKSGSIILVAKDARESKLIKELQDAQGQLVQTEKLAALGEMAGGVAHEINNPVAIIHAGAEFLQMAAEEDQIDRELVARLANDILNTSQRIAKIVKGLRMVSRDSGQDPMAEFSLREIFEDSLSLCLEKLKSNGVDVQVELEGLNRPAIWCRPSQISQVILNLLQNSNDVLSDCDERRVDVRINNIGDSIRFSVSDTGPGVSPAHRERIFEPFFTTKDVGKGTGLGLSISKKIIEQHKGKFYLEAADSLNSSTFVFELPVYVGSGRKVEKIDVAGVVSKIEKVNDKSVNRIDVGKKSNSEKKDKKVA